MFKTQMIFVGHSKGVMEGTHYDNVKLSNGIGIFKIKNETGQEFTPELGYIPEKSKVDVTLTLKSNKELASLAVVQMSISK